MSLFDQILAADAAFMVQAEFTEFVTVYPREGAPIANVPAVVSRETPEQFGNGPERLNAPQIKVFLANGQAGITSIDVHGGQIGVAFLVGGTPERHRIAQILSQDAGGWLLLLR